MPVKPKRGRGRPKVARPKQLLPVSISIDSELLARLDAAAKEERRSRSSMAVVALKAGLDSIQSP